MEKKIQTIRNFRIEYAMEDPSRPDDTDWYEKNSYLSSHEEYDERGNMIKSLSYNHAGDIHEHYRYTFDEENRMVEQFVYFDENEIVEHHFFVYDDSNNQIQEKIIYEEGGEAIIEFFYDENGNMVKRVQKDVDGEVEETETFLFENGRMLCSEMYDEENQLRSRRNYEYNEQGKLVKFTYFTPEPGTGYVTEHYYNEKGLREKTLKYNSGNQLIEKTLFSYDEQDNVTEIIEEDPLTLKKTCLTYDDKNNAVKHEEYNRDDELLISIERTYHDDGKMFEALVYSQNPAENIRNMYTSKFEYTYFNE
ncbi:MAG TPA: hypothetical protein PKW80_01825 [Bacteroidales bacterium]|nr:hypothetical protein [Bacteroidales bacterium]